VEHYTSTHTHVFEIASSDIMGDPRASAVQLDMTRVVCDLAKVMCWYDNEWGFTYQLVRQALQELGPKEGLPAVATS
jgi:glyceraldehyde 3-phosphate dehydrogenase